MDLLSRFEYRSQVIPGVVVVLKRFTVTTRAAYQQSLATFRAQIREIQRRRKPLDEAYDKAWEAAKAIAKAEVDRLIESEQIDRAVAEKRVPVKSEFPDDQFAEWSALVDEQKRIERDSLGLSGLRAQFVSIRGLSINGVEVSDAETLLAEAPGELADELIRVANEIAGLGATERGESPWPGTSPQAEVGPKSNTSAIPAEPEKEPV